MTEVLLIVPHPDDEAFGSGALLARAAATGRGAATLTLTRGRAGRSLDLCTRAELPALREHELRTSLATLGVQDVTILDHPDYVPDADRGLEPDPGLAGVPRSRLVADVVATIERTEPRVIVTFPPNGSNGHPDHVTAHEVVLAALTAARHRPERLYYFASDQPFAGPQRDGFLAADEMRARHLAPTHLVPAGRFLETKLRAIACHRTQALSVVTFMQRFPHRLLVESFHRAIPSVEPGVGTIAVDAL
jgi:N-acetylglucosamine malate deacetylase 2